MGEHLLLFPEHVKSKLARQYAAKHGDWLTGGGVWPLAIPLGIPNEKDARAHLDIMRNWLDAWGDWRGSGCLEWHERHWNTLGIQRLPKTLCLANAGQVADWLGEDERWKCAIDRYGRLVERWPTLRGTLPKHYEVLADYSEQDFTRLHILIAWLSDNPKSNLYPRQLPITGLDSKWLEKRMSLTLSLLSSIQGVGDTSDFFDCCGLRPIPRLVRMRILDPELRSCAGGLSDLSAPADDLAILPLQIRCAIIVENLQTGLAFEELSGTVVLMGLGYDVEPIGQFGWLCGKPIFYWGDLDTHGFAILNRARAYQPQIASCLMDERTLLSHKAFWGVETKQHGAMELPNLTKEELDVYHGLKEQRWGHSVRLEQERVDWLVAWEEIRNRHFALGPKR